MYCRPSSRNDNSVVGWDSYNAKMSLTIKQAQSSCLVTLILGGLENRQIQTNFLQLLFWEGNVTGCIWGTDDWKKSMLFTSWMLKYKICNTLSPSNLSYFCVDRNVEEWFTSLLLLLLRYVQVYIHGYCSSLECVKKKRCSLKVWPQGVIHLKKRQQRLIITGNWTCFHCTENSVLF